MLSNRYARVVLRKILLDAINTGEINLPTDQIAWENRTFINNNYDYFLEERLFPIDDTPSSNISDGGLGIYELTLYVSKGIEGTEDAEDICAEICNAYIIGVGGNYNNVDIIIDEARVETTLEQDSYWYFPIRIDYRKFDVND